MGIKTYTGKDRFTRSVIRKMLVNEKFCGGMMLQKCVARNVGSGYRDVNHNLKTKYFIENNHEGIVSKELFERAQKIRQDRANSKPGVTNGYKMTYSDHGGFVYSSVAHRFYKYKVNCKGTKWELRLFALFKSETDVDLPPIHVRQIDEIKNEITKTLASDVKAFRTLVSQELAKRIEYSNIEERLNTLESKRQETANKLLQVSFMEIDDEAKNSIKKRLEDERADIDTKLAVLRCEKIMRFDYEKNLLLLEKKLRQIHIIEDNVFGYKSIINFVIANSRDDLLFCIHLSNRSLSEINLDNEILNEPILSGIKPYKQTRLSLNTNWKVIII